MTPDARSLSDVLAGLGIARYRTACADNSGCWHWWRGNEYLGFFNAFEGWKYLRSSQLVK